MEWSEVVVRKEWSQKSGPHSPLCGISSLGAATAIALETIALETIALETAQRTVRTTIYAGHSNYHRGYGRLLLDEITQADEGCDFKFLATAGETPEPDIF